MILSVILLGTKVYGLDNGVGLTPPMGWSSWSLYQDEVTEDDIKTAAYQLKRTGLKNKGYLYVNIGDGWSASERNSSGYLQADPDKFPGGISSLSDYVHKKGLKLGLYSGACTYTCSGYIGSLGYEESDASTFASWGVDYLEYDNCCSLGHIVRIRYRDMENALNESGRPIFYSINDSLSDNSWVWGRETGNSWRTAAYKNDVWETMVNNFYQNSLLGAYSGTGGWNNPNLLQIGLGGMTATEYKTHFSLWAMAKAPLIIACDLSTIDESSLSILKNSEIISLNQDTLGMQAECISGCDYNNYLYGTNINVFYALLYNGDVALSFTNFADYDSNYTFSLKDIGINGTAVIVDLWNYTVTVSDEIVIDYIASHDIKVFRVTPAQDEVEASSTANKNTGYLSTDNNGKDDSSTINYSDTEDQTHTSLDDPTENFIEVLRFNYNGFN
jgi:alpha-galactosidase